MIDRKSWANSQLCTNSPNFLPCFSAFRTGGDKPRPYDAFLDFMQILDIFATAPFFLLA